MTVSAPPEPSPAPVVPLVSAVASEEDWVPHTHDYLSAPVVALCRRLGARRVLDLGCGTGSLCKSLIEAGIDAVGCDIWQPGLETAAREVPRARFHQLGVYDDPGALDESGFDAVVSTEVVEHLYYPRALPRFARAVLRDGGHLIVSTPYHGYLKNLFIALLDHWDAHHSALWDTGHIKFFSRAVLTRMLSEEGFEVDGFEGSGRFPYFWKSMILTARKLPASR
jgi:2-polyprenyl-3-methyl-5-hydroxy-6-metoxy-1,4-benzoquinol methylase